MMNTAQLSKVLFLLWMSQCCVAVKQQIHCGEAEKHNKYGCEGTTITLACPKEKPWLQVTSASFGRTLYEFQVCVRPGNSDPRHTKLIKCTEDVKETVAGICGDQTPCTLNVNNATFRDPCPEVYKYIYVTFNCNCRRRSRYTREETSSSSKTCLPRKPNSTSFTHTIIHSTPSLTTIGQSMSQNVTKLMHVPISITAMPTMSTQSLAITPTISANSSRNSSRKLPQYGGRRNKAFLLMVELFVIYNEAASEDPPMALMWCFIGILLGLFIITITFLILGLRRKPNDKNLFRLSQLESEDGEIPSPTIHTTTQFPESPDLDRRQVAVEKLNPTRGGKHVPGGLGSWSELLREDTSLYINPLWRGWREGYTGLTAQGGEAELDTGHDEGLTRSEPWNLRRAGESEDSGHHDSDGQGDDSNSSRNSSNSGSSSERNSGSEANNDTNNNQQPDNPDTEQSSSITNNNDPSRETTNTRRSITECDNLVTSIPVGIPSHPVQDPRVFHTEQTSRTTNTDDSQIKPEVINTIKPEVVNAEQLQEGKPSTTIDHKPASSNLLSRFGINNEDGCPSSRPTALSSPCLYNDDLSKEVSRPGKQDFISSPNTNSRLIVCTKPTRSRSLDSYCASEITPLHHTHASHHPTPHNPTSQHPTAHDPTTQHQNKPPPYVKNKISPNLKPKISAHDKTNIQPQNKEPNQLSVTKRPARNPPMERRASSGYYSNNTSPMVEYAKDITTAKNSGKKSEQRPQKESSLKRKQSSGGDDDLPPLPPPPPPFIPISPLPHMCLIGYREPKTKNENSVDKNPSRTAVRKVHFKSSE